MFHLGILSSSGYNLNWPSTLYEEDNFTSNKSNEEKNRNGFFSILGISNKSTNFLDSCNCENNLESISEESLQMFIFTSIK